MSPDQYCADRAAASGSSFYYSFRLLPPSRRRAITAVYAFCREVDDIVDECSSADVARAKLAWWSEELAAVFAGKPQHPVGQALVPVVREFSLSRACFEAIIEGMAWDLDRNRYADFAELKEYCHRAAGVVGELAASIFGKAGPATVAYAHELGLALQLTNIIRDVGEDARRGRIYLPVDELARFGVPEADILNSRYGPEFLELMRFQDRRASECYQRALNLLPAGERSAQRPGLVMAAIYATLLREIRHSDYQVLHQKIYLGPLRKILVAAKSALIPPRHLP